MRVDVLTLFPEMFVPVIGASMLKIAAEKGLLTVSISNIRDFAYSKHRVVDDTPFGGGAGMVMKPEPLVIAVENALAEGGPMEPTQRRVILMTPAGKIFSQAKAVELANLRHLVLICGHYEGIDQRVVDLVVDEELSIGDYVLTGGELPAMVVIDCVARLLPGVLGSELSARDETFAGDGWLEYPHYTRPREFRGRLVPEVLLSGDHARIARWRRGQSIKRTQARRPDLITANLSLDDKKCLCTVMSEDGKED
ncbi:MAG: tRNA (guanosine(37)-N1)-methyltransferase TrmD [Peptococcaceae bacterium]|nr:tRNA (guanosine(37)-N1)-methyltransferase TrmD [Peptococcaceae bacterium]